MLSDQHTNVGISFDISYTTVQGKRIRFIRAFTVNRATNPNLFIHCRRMNETEPFFPIVHFSFADRACRQALSAKEKCTIGKNGSVSFIRRQ